MQETVCQSCVNTALPKDSADIRHTGAAPVILVHRRVCPSLRREHVALGFMLCIKGEERVQISSEIMTFEAESLEGQVRASVLKSPARVSNPLTFFFLHSVTP